MNVAQSVDGLNRMTTRELRDRYRDVFQEPALSNNRVFLIKRIAWRMQSQVEGTLSDRARQRAQEIANEADLRLNPPRTAQDEMHVERQPQLDERLPPPGNTIVKKYKGANLRVAVLADGFEYQGRRYRTLSAVAKEISGAHCNGFHFFGLCKKGVPS